MADRSPLTVTEARITWVRGVRSGRQKGIYVYLDADLLRSVGLDPEADIEAMRYGLRDVRKRADGTEATRARIVLNLRLLQEQTPDGGEGVLG